MKIGELSRAAGFSQKTIRFYEQIGLLPVPARTESGYREYSHSHLEQLQFISRAKRLGLTLNDIRDILGLLEGGEPPCVHVERLLQDRLAELRRVQEELSQLEHEVDSTLKRMRDALTKPGAAKFCSVIEHAQVTPIPLPLAERALRRRAGKAHVTGPS